ncbi:MAG: aminoacyl-tRNA hydrolase [Acidobacteriota bacterium]
MEREGATNGLRVVLGLGNPGERYDDTRHNVGFRVVAELARRRGVTLDHDECRSDLVEVDDLLLVAPRTFMNRSGWAARCLAEGRDLSAADFLVVYDEVHLPLGTLRLRPKGSPAGHRGLESVLENLGTDGVPRLRLGIAPADPPPGEALPDFVLGRFEKDEAEAVDAMILRAADACDTWARDGVEAAARAFNGPPADS